MKIRTALKQINVIQERSKSGYRFNVKSRRVNPYNPLSYIVLILGFIIGIVCFGIIGFWNEIDTDNPFKWN